MKYFSHKCTDKDGNVCDSTNERDRSNQLLRMEEAGLITGLQRQVKFEVKPRTDYQATVVMKTKTKLVWRCHQRASIYTADFVYQRDGWNVIEEVKSKYTSTIRDWPSRKKDVVLMVIEKNKHLADGELPWTFNEVIGKGGEEWTPLQFRAHC